MRSAEGEGRCPCYPTKGPRPLETQITPHRYGTDFYTCMPS